MRLLICCLLWVFQPIYGTACCGEEPHLFAEMLLHDTYDRSIFRCQIIDSYADMEGVYYSKARVLKVYKGAVDRDTVWIGTGQANSSAGGSVLTPGQEWLICSRSIDGWYGTGMCDVFSCSLQHDPAKFAYETRILDDFLAKKQSRYSGPIRWLNAGGTVMSVGKMKNGAATGNWKFYNAEGALISEPHYKRGLLHGWVRVQNGTSTVRERYKYGVLVFSKARYRTNTGWVERGSKRLRAAPGGAVWEFYKKHVNGKIAEKYQRYMSEPGSYYWSGKPYFMGPFVTREMNGKIVEKGRYWRGAKVGHWIETDPSGKQVTRDYPVPAPLNRDYYAFYPDGQLAVEGDLVDGKPHGNWTYYSERSKKPFRTAQFAHGIQVGVEEFFDEKGHIFLRSRYKNGKKEGEEVGFFSNGTPSSHWFYKNGLKNGPFTEYYDAGAWTKQGFYSDNALTGDYIQRNERGDTLVVARMVEGHFEGFVKEINREKRPKIDFCEIKSGLYKNGFKTGTWTVAECDGRVKNTMVYDYENHITRFK